jgi:hypothetical protein
MIAWKTRARKKKVQGTNFYEDNRKRVARRRRRD